MKKEENYNFPPKIYFVKLLGHHAGVGAAKKSTGFATLAKSRNYSTYPHPETNIQR
jgi:hypothetical protein